ncbi:MAG: redoxin domain-containing protein [Bryobacterales bacterium]|nr:redoxin domain-containing protein [Bryobacterales bacterium]
MKRMLLLGIAVFAASALYGQEFKLGSAVTDFSLQDLSGNQVAFSGLKGDLTVLMFVATQCPVSNAYNERMKELYNDYSPRGVKFVAVNANNTEPAAEVAAHAAKHGFGFTVYKDEGNQVADRFGAQVTPEVFLIGRTGTILYHGSIDDSQNAANITSKGLRLALDSTLAGQAVAKAQTKAFGCTIKRVKRVS